MNKNRFLSILILLSLFLSLAGCDVLGKLPFLQPTPTPAEEETGCSFKIGIITDISGRNKTGGQEHMQGYEIAIDEINAAGGILGCPAKLVVKDDASDNAQAAAMVTELVKVDNVPVILGAYSSGATLAAIAEAENLRVPFMVPTASNELVNALGYQWIFRINATATDYVNTALKFAASLEDPQIRTMAIVFEHSSFGNAAVAAVSAAEEYGISVVAYERFIPKSSSYFNILEAVQQADPDLIFFISNSVDDAVLLMKQSQALNINPKLYMAIAGAFSSPAFLTQAGANAEYVIATVQWASDVNWTDQNGQSAADFVQKFKQRYNAEPGMRSVQTYTALMTVKQAIEDAAGSSTLDFNNMGAVRRDIQAALQRLEIEKSLFGPINFDSTGQNPHPVLLVQVINGGYVTVYPDEYKAQDAIVPVPAWSDR